MPNSRDPQSPIASTVDSTVRLFRLSLLSTVGVTGLFVLSWPQRGIWPLIEGALISVSLFFGGRTLLFTLRARELTAPTAIRAWMRPAVIADFILAVALGGLTLWRWGA